MVGGWGGGGLQSHFRVQTNNCVEVVLRCVVVGVVTKFFEKSQYCENNGYIFGDISTIAGRDRTRTTTVE